LDKLFIWSMWHSQVTTRKNSSKLDEINVLEACRTWSYSLSSALIFVHPLAPLRSIGPKRGTRFHNSNETQAGFGHCYVLELFWHAYLSP
jgi:hypothetical protein